MVYAAERQRHLADFIGRRAAATQVRNGSLLQGLLAWRQTDDELGYSHHTLEPDG